MVPRHHCGLACIIPPTMLRALARSDDPERRDAALRTLLIDATLRATRIHNAVSALGAPRATVLQGLTPGRPDRTVFDCENEMPVRAPRVARREGGPPAGDREVDEAYDGLGATYELFWERFGRDSIDDRGMPLHGWVHYGRDYDNAFWDGAQMVFGDGRLFAPFTRSLDVIGHELTHGVTEHTARLQYLNQSGALNESVSDVFGSLVRQHRLGQTAAEADWLIGADLVLPGFPGVALRSMAAPGTAWEQDDQPAHMDDYVRTLEDNGGVHINSGIPNRAFHLVATALGGPAWERAGRVWYDALRDPALRPDATFAAFAALTAAAAARRGGEEAGAVGEAWAAVGVAVP